MLSSHVKHALRPVWHLNRMESIGDRIATARKRSGMSQTDLGNACGVSRSAISQWEDDGTVPTGPNLVAAAVAMEVSPEWLATGIERHILFFDESEMSFLSKFRALDENAQATVLQLLDTIAPQTANVSVAGSLKKAAS